jgi:hypothetical protein
VSRALEAGAPPAAVRSPRATAPFARRDALLPAALWLAAALVSGFTIWRYLDPFDEGLLLMAAQRIARGQWPYADFAWPYGPGHPLLMTLADAGLGDSVLWWRLVRSAADATIAVLVFALVRRQAGTRWALAAWAAAAVTMAQPVVANPFPVAFALGLGALLAAARGRAGLAGVFIAIAAFWRPDFGVAAVVAVVLTLLASGDRRAAARAALVAAAGAFALYLPFLVAAGPHALWENLAGVSLREGAAWRLPFPVLYDGPLRAWPPGDLLRDGKDLVGYQLPAAALLALVIAVLVIVRRRPRDTAALAIPAGLAVLAAFGALYLRSRADEFHVQPLAVAAAALLAIGAARSRGAERALLGALLGLIVAAGFANRLSALVLPPALQPLHLPGVPGIRVPPAEAAALPRVVADVQRLVPPGRAVYVAPRRSDLVAFTDPLLYVLVRRPSVLRQDASLLARRSEQEQVVAALRRQHPVVIRWLDPLSARREPNERGRPSGSRVLDEYLARAYVERARHGAYAILVPR